MLRALPLLALLLPGTALAASVYLNGVKIDGVTNQTFQNCQVNIDAHGNVHITAKGYAVGGAAAAAAPVQPATQTATAGGPPTRRYWLVTEKAAPGMSQYNIELFINSVSVRKFLDVEEHMVVEITKYLRSGPNKLLFMAKKDVGSTRRSASPQHYFRVIIGEGAAGGRDVMINKKEIDYKRTAFEMQDFNDEFTLMAQ